MPQSQAECKAGMSPERTVDARASLATAFCCFRQREAIYWNPGPAREGGASRSLLPRPPRCRLALRPATTALFSAGYKCCRRVSVFFFLFCRRWNAFVEGGDACDFPYFPPTQNGCKEKRSKGKTPPLLSVHKEKWCCCYFIFAVCVCVCVCVCVSVCTCVRVSYSSQHSLRATGREGGK